MKVLDCKASDNDYLHMDFHGALCYAIHYLDTQFGYDVTAAYLKQVGRTCYAPLIARLKKEGLTALETHFGKVFEKENGKFDMAMEDGALVLQVKECPAIRHLVQQGQLYTDRFCESTALVNETICHSAGYESACVYEPGVGKCIQRFWKERKK
jgi:hypothetical protein